MKAVPKKLINSLGQLSWFNRCRTWYAPSFFP